MFTLIISGYVYCKDVNCVLAYVVGTVRHLRVNALVSSGHLISRLLLWLWVKDFRGVAAVLILGVWKIAYYLVETAPTASSAAQLVCAWKTRAEYRPEVFGKCTSFMDGGKGIARYRCS